MQEAEGTTSFVLILKEIKLRQYFLSSVVRCVSEYAFANSWYRLLFINCGNTNFLVFLQLFLFDWYILDIAQTYLSQRMNVFSGESTVYLKAVEGSRRTKCRSNSVEILLRLSWVIMDRVLFTTSARLAPSKHNIFLLLQCTLYQKIFVDTPLQSVRFPLQVIDFVTTYTYIYLERTTDSLIDIYHQALPNI